MADIVIRVEKAGNRRASIFIIGEGVKIPVTDKPLDVELALYAATEIQAHLGLPDERVVVSKGLLKRRQRA